MPNKLIIGGKRLGIETAKEYSCPDCGKVKLIDTSKNNYDTYITKYPRCHSCGAKYSEDKLKGTWFKKNESSWNKGRYGEDNAGWKGDNISKDGLHDWVERMLGKPSECSNCKTTEKGKVFQWSNISGEYKRDLSDWQRFCVKCHQRYDYEKFGCRKKFYE